MGMISETPEQVIREFRKLFAETPIEINPLINEEMRFIPNYKYGELINISIQAGLRVASIPREFLKDFDAYTHYEICLTVDDERDTRFLHQVESKMQGGPEIIEGMFIYRYVGFSELMEMLTAIKDVTFQADTSYKIPETRV